MQQLLVLFDVDGTLFLTDDPLAGQALRETLSARFGVELPRDALERVDHAGQTTLRSARLVRAQAGLGEDASDTALGDWCGEFSRRYVELLSRADTSGWRAAPREPLERLAAAGHLLALLTGNPEPMARARMKLLGLNDLFPPGQGGFGCEAESRAELIDHARQRAGEWPAATTVEVGDTPRDASTAREAGVRSIVIDEAGVTGAVERLLASTA